MPLPNILRLKEGKWDNPEDSIGTFIGYLRGGRYSCWEAAGPARQAFRELSPDIKDFLETSSIPPTEIVSWSMYMIGHNERNAAPKLLICSTDAKTRKNIRQLIKDSNIMGKYPGIGLGDVSSLPDRPVIRELSREAIEALLPFGCIRDGAVLADGSEPALGKRIFVVNPYDFSLRPATTGPIILQDGKCYQLTVAHAFRYTREVELSPGRQMAEDDCDFDGMSDTERDDGSQYDEMTRKGSVTPGDIDSDKASFMASFDASSGDKRSSSRSESPPSDHLDSGHDPRQSVESLEDNPGPGEIDVSHLKFYGKLVLSSLTGRNPSLDYALIETSRMPEDTEKSSMITGSLVSSIGEIESDDISIVTRTSPHCRVEGRLTATPSYIRLPEQRAFQQVYPIRLGKPLHDGDCGTAVFGKDDNRFYGHIVAGSPGTSIAYLVPAEEISRDIQARLGFGLTWMPQQKGLRFSWRGTSTDASSASDKLPKRQNSTSTDDIEYRFPKRLRIIHQSPRLPHPFPASVNTAQPATGLSLEASVDTAQRMERRTYDIPPSPTSNDSGSSSTQRDEAAGSIARKLVLPKDFEGACETCIFWLYSPEMFSSPEWHACRGRKEEISHIVTHITDHHGLIRGHDPKYPARKYLASCRSSNPFVKAKGNCTKCHSLSEWNDTDFADIAHHGVVLCLRCWRTFDKKGMKEHIAGPVCDYNPEQPKAKKLWILYTVFCSDTQLPSKPPKSMAPRKSLHRPSLRTIRKGPQQAGQNHTAAPAYNLGATRSPSGTRPLLPRLQSGSSLIPSTARESTELLHSPNLSMHQPMWLQEGAGDFWSIIGSNPELQTPIDAAGPRPLQVTDRHQELEPKDKISPLQMAAMEKDSGYRSEDEEFM
ncbi:uncharacterized protein FTJAE_1972 [Fusarium tjaetaba]|uniref:Uncharacterized protein n=1 Tax=Fusarium tjaetaba TaxID=1567544 RepID=A0A8H5W2K6_9HYPO|nr:uncharacterized protein FTJAE_1972 [Fusarium tjaetaba]KAF5646682.1 hypothetical protein FTJAE_1972 [Fusarium tjaetaba]